MGGQTVVEYAADVPTKQFGSGFERFEETPIDPKKEGSGTHPWNLNNIPTQANSLMQFPRDHDICGINIPWLYIGMKFSTFCWHYEDLMLFSLNYSHWGKAKQWYCVPNSDREKFEKACHQKLALLFKKDPNILLDMVTMISPAFLAKNKVSKFLS
jgi:[histone H3]-trimethyl-L-lysine4 demethylase